MSWRSNEVLEKIVMRIQFKKKLEKEEAVVRT